MKVYGCVYGLHDPQSGELRYIGQTTYIHRRIAEARRAGKEIPTVRRKAWNRGLAQSPEHYAARWGEVN